MFVRTSRALLSTVLVLSATPALAASSDTQFAMQAAQGGMAEVQMGKLAMQKSKNPVVTSFAQRMVADHTAANAKLSAIVKSQGMTPPAMVDPNSRMMMTKLQRLSGSAFDRAYLAAQLPAHQQMQILMQSEINGGKDARLVAFAKTTLPTVNMHLSLAKADVAKLRSGGSMGKGSMSGGSMSGGAMPGGSMGSPMPSGSMGSPMPSGSTAPSGATSPGGAMSSPMPAGSMSPGGSMPSSPNPAPSSKP